MGAVSGAPREADELAIATASSAANKKMERFTRLQYPLEMDACTIAA